MEIEKKRRPSIALLLSFLTPGLGQLYNGQLKKAILLYLILFAIAASPLLVGALSTFHGMIVWCVVTICLFFFVVIDALYNAIKLKEIKIRAYNKWYLYLIIILIHTFAFQSLFKSAMPFKGYKMPAGSMKPTLIVGDHFIINKAYYKEKEPVKNDVVVFPFPKDTKKDFIKRVIGLPGDVVEIRDKHVYINGILQNYSYAVNTDPHIIPGGIQPRDNFGPITVPERSLFVMGDNRDQSYDSRFWGFVDITELKGKALYIYWSKDRSRIGREIK
jgi:signal peptidase I